MTARRSFSDSFMTLPDSRLRSAMKIVDGAQFWLWPRLAQNHGPHESRQHLGEAKTAVESVSRFGEVAPCILGLAKGVIAAADGAFHVAQHHVHPARTLDLSCRPSSSRLKHGVRMIEFNEAAKATQPVAEDFGAGCKAPCAPVLSGVGQPLTAAVVSSVQSTSDISCSRLLKMTLQPSLHNDRLCTAHSKHDVASNLLVVDRSASLNRVFRSTAPQTPTPKAGLNGAPSPYTLYVPQRKITHSAGDQGKTADI